MRKLYIIRHGRTDWNNLGILQGSSATSLNDEGIRSAEEISKKINFNDIDICICSPLKRAKETAELIVKNRVKIIYDDLLVERGFGSFEGKKIDFDLINKMWDYDLNYDSNNIESLRNCLKRSRKFLDKIYNKCPDKNILIVSHGSFIKTLHFNLTGYNKDTDFLSFSPKNATIYSYYYK